jgi:hypothetical protein
MERWLAAREISRAQLEEQPDVTVARDVAYERLDALDRLHSPELHPGHFYFARDELRMVYLPPEGLPASSAEEVAALLGEPEARLRSRAGLESRLEVYAELGFAISHEGERIDFVEVFPPATIDGYLADVYEEPA